jgi:hypothetical protein
MNKFRTPIGFLISLMALSLVIASNTALFFYGKVFIEPEWTKSLYDPTLAGWTLVLLSLVPSVLLPSSTRAASKAIAGAVLAAPLPALITYALELTSEIATNAAFQYVWIVVLGCALPALVALALAFGVNAFRSNKRGGD